ncbi:MAG: substrate-binding domain-containing protein [Akkermansiaceae bacterium]|nr:substrate-binding domain-containing protein [Akkermansiaceae bacterium]
MKTQELSAARPRVVGVWLDVEWGLKLELETYAGCQRYAREAGWRLVLDPSVKRLHQWAPGRAPYDGILARATQPMADAARRRGLPFVNLWLNSPVRNMASVFPDCEAAGALAAEHLLGRGLRNFGYLGSRRPRLSKLLLKGFRAAVGWAGFRCTPYFHPHSVTEHTAPLWERFQAGLEEWIGTWRPPIGVLVDQDIFCRFLIDACAGKGLAVPGDVAVVGCADDNIICESSAPSLSSIDLGYENRGYQAAALLDQLMAGHPAPAEPVLVPPARLIPRQSSDIFATTDPLVARALRFMAERSDRLLAVGEVAKEVGVARRTLERRFRDAVGRSIAGEMMRLRLNRAKRRLAEGNVPLKTVAQETGFRHASHFSRVFTQVLGTTPSRYRNERRSARGAAEDEGTGESGAG